MEMKRWGKIKWRNYGVKLYSERYGAKVWSESMEQKYGVKL
jgi:hypothetical protein